MQPLAQEITGLQEEVVWSEVYPARQEVHMVGLVGEQVEQGALQFLAQAKEGVRVYPGRQVLQPISEQDWQNSASQAVHTSLVLR